MGDSKSEYKRAARVRACNYVKFKPGRNLPPVLKIVTRPAHTALTLATRSYALLVIVVIEDHIHACIVHSHLSESLWAEAEDVRISKKFRYT